MTRILFTSDLHGSTLSFKKLLSAAKIYKADVVIIGGDLTGKAIVPIVELLDGTYRAQLFGQEHKAKTKEELGRIESLIEDSGLYFYRTTSQEYEKLTNNDNKKIEDLFKSLMISRIKSWVELAENHLKNLGIKFYMLPGNDDEFVIDDVINKSDYIVNPEGKVVWIDNDHEMISSGYVNMTPWRCPRDVPDEVLAEKIEAMVSQLKNPKNAIFTFHAPPYHTKLDLAPKLDKDLRVVTRGGQVIMDHVGSISVRKYIEKYQPILGLHGHIHESRGFDRIGRTLCINPGSEYTEGTLDFAFIVIEGEKIKSYSLNIS